MSMKLTTEALIQKYQAALIKMANEGLREHLADVNGIDEYTQIQSYITYLNNAYPDFVFHYSLAISKIYCLIKINS